MERPCVRGVGASETGRSRNPGGPRAGTSGGDRGDCLDNTDRAPYQDEAKLVGQCRAGDTSALAVIYQRYRPGLLRYVQSILSDPYEAEDVVQDAFARAFEAISRFQSDKGAFRAWLFTIARNCAYDHLRARARHELTSPQALSRWRDGHASKDEAAATEAESTVAQHLERLPQNQRLMLFLRFQFDLSPRDIAEMLGRSEVSVRKLQSRGMRAVEERFAWEDGLIDEAA